MKNRLIKKALCVALASTMVFGEALPAMAADGSADVQSAQAEVAFAEEASITYFSCRRSGYRKQRFCTYKRFGIWNRGCSLCKWSMV